MKAAAAVHTHEQVFVRTGVHLSVLVNVMVVSIWIRVLSASVFFCGFFVVCFCSIQQPCHRFHVVCVVALNKRPRRAEAPPIIGGKGLRQWQVCQRKAFLNSWSMVDRLAQLERENAELRKENNKLLKQVNTTVPLRKMEEKAKEHGTSFFLAV